MSSSPLVSTTPLRTSSSHDLLSNYPPPQGYEKPTIETPTKRRKNRRLAYICIGVLLIAVIAVAVAIGITKSKHKSNNAVAQGNSTGNSSTSSTSSVPGSRITIGGDGSLVTTVKGTQFTYNNSFGGYWVTDLDNPYNNAARPNSWTPPLNTSWTWGVDRINGVNLGGLFVLEPFITPAYFDKYSPVADEWSLTDAMRKDTTAGGGTSQLENHYDTFITEEDIAQIAGAGLNWVRIPIAFWAIETWDGEAFLPKTSWKYFLRVLEWVRKYGLRVYLDLHAVPGSQNGLNHSGRLSPVNFLSGNMGMANAQRTLYYIRVITEFISQPAYRDLIPVFGIVNEALLGIIGKDVLTSFYLESHRMIRDIAGSGAGNGPYITIHDGFQSLDSWNGFLQGSDRIILDTHPYFSFGAPDTSPIAALDDKGNPGGKWPLQACIAWGGPMNSSRSNFGVVVAGEFAASPNDCGYFMRGVGPESTNPDCPVYDDYQHYNESMKAGIANYVLASMDAMRDWFFWTWKIGPNKNGVIGAPSWSYQLGLQEGWMPKDPRTSYGKCADLGMNLVIFNGTFAPWATGVTSTIPASSSATYPWPPATISNANVALTLLPTYTATGPAITLPPDTFTSAAATATASANGWYNPKDDSKGFVPVAGCSYPDEYNGIFTTPPTQPCTGPS